MNIVNYINKKYSKIKETIHIVYIYNKNKLIVDNDL